MPSARPDVVVIGAGLMGKWHAATAHRLGARIVAVVDPDSSRADTLARTYRASALPGLDRLLQDEQKPAVAHVCTPLADHAVACARLIAAGYHVICEKPLAATAEEVRDLLALGEGAGRQLCVVHQFTVQPGLESVLDRRTALEPLRHIAFVFCTAGASPHSDRDDLLLDVLPHPLSVLRRLFPAEPVAQLNWHLDHPSSGELHLATSIAGVPVSILLSCSARPTEASACIRGAGGTAHVDFFHGYASFSGPEVSRARKIAQPIHRPLGQMLAAGSNLARRLVAWEPAYPGLREFIRRFYDSLNGTGPPPIAIADIIDVYQAREVISAAMGNRS